MSLGMTSMADKNECYCIIKHARTPEERKQVEEALATARRLKDKQGITIAQLQLGHCPQDNPPLQSNFRPTVWAQNNRGE